MTRVASQPTADSANTAATTGRVEMSVWTMKEPTSRAPTNDSVERSRAEAHRRMKSTSGRMTTIGFHGLTSAPSPPSE